MKFLIDTAPAILFFVVYSYAGIYTATIVLIVSLFGVVAAYGLLERRLHKMHLVTAIIATVFGGLTLAIHDPAFIKFKPTALYAIFAVALLLSHFIGDRVLLQRLPQKVIVAPDVVWRRLNLVWTAFFLFCAALNLYVAAHYDEATWVTFKTFGFSALMFVFLLAHAPVLSRYQVRT